MNMPRFWMLWMGLIGSLGAVKAVPADGRPEKPNIILMMADDMGLGDTSAYLGRRLSPGSDPIPTTLRTPHLDSLAAMGLTFTDAHAPASMCSSTRYSLLTGRFAHRAYLKRQGWLPHGPNAPMIQRALVTLPEMLQGNGYHTAIVGKYHVGIAMDDGYGEPADEFDFHDVDFSKPLLDGPTHHGFHEFFGVPGNTEDPLDTEPRIFIRNDRWVFSDRSQMKRIGMKKRAGRILAAPDWNLADLGAIYLREVLAYVNRRAAVAQPFFLYYVPNANHFQRNPTGSYAVPEALAGEPIKGRSRYTNGERAGDREDMVIENDVAMGKLLERLRATEDPRWPGHRLIENTLIIFTSDNGPNVGNNLERNQESGGLRGKKAKLWEGGIRVPFLLYWAGQFEGGGVNRSLFSLTDLYATLASLIGHELEPQEAADSHDSLRYWYGKANEADRRPRVFFCHLGPPYLNDALAIRRGSLKVIVEGGFAMPSMVGGTLGGLEILAFYDLGQDLYETGRDPRDGEGRARGLASELMRLHQRGYARGGMDEAGAVGPLVLDDGWHNLRNDVSGSIGMMFTVSETRRVTHLGLWDCHNRDRPVRVARGVPRENENDQPSLSDGRNRVLVSEHLVRIHRAAAGRVSEVGRVAFDSGKPGELEGEFRYGLLSAPIELIPGETYVLTMTTRAGDGDYFHGPVSFDGLSPVLNPVLDSVRGVMFREDDFSRPLPIPSFADLADSFSEFRVPVGPTLKFATRPLLP